MTQVQYPDIDTTLSKSIEQLDKWRTGSGAALSPPGLIRDSVGY